MANATVEEMAGMAARIPQLRAVATNVTKVNEADTAWLLVCTALVLMMTIPGLAMFYGGLVRPRNYIHTAMQSFTITALCGAIWMIFGYSLAFTPGVIIGGKDRFFLRGMSPNSVSNIAPNVPESVFMAFQMTFSIITPALTTGAVAERMKFSSLLIFTAAWSIFVYPPIAHAVWHHDGFLWKAHALDFAGGDVVHVASGASALVASIMVGKRRGKHFEPNNIAMSLIGASFLWVGWSGFNGGSALSSGPNAGFAVATTHISACMGALSWMFMEWLVHKRPTVLSVISGAVAGLVGITPSCGFVDFTGAFVIGITTAVVCFYGVMLKEKLGFDDALDAFGLHGIGGMYGGILTGLFANPDVNPNFRGAFYGNPKQIAKQLYGIVVCFFYPAFMTFLILTIIKLTIGLRVEKKHERAGQDKSIHGERINYHLDMEHLETAVDGYADNENSDDESSGGGGRASAVDDRTVRAGHWKEALSSGKKKRGGSRKGSGKVHPSPIGEVPEVDGIESK